MSATTVTVIVPTFNRAHFLGPSIDSLLAQSCPPAQIIVVDDGSTDGTRQVAQAYAGRVEYVANANGGKSSALNVAAQHVRGSHVWIMDDDDIVLPNALAELLAPHIEDPQLDYSFGSCVHAELDESHRPSRTIKTMPARYEDALHLYRLCASNYVFLNACLIRRETFMNAGPFDERLIRSQDYDFLLRLSCNARFRYVGTQIYWLREHQGVRGTRTETISHRQRSAAWRRYDRILGEKLFTFSPDAWFLHPELLDATAAQIARATAIRKAFIAATKGLVERIPEHLGQAVGHGAGLPLHAQEATTIQALFDDRDFVEAMTTDPAYERSVQAILQRLPKCSPRTMLAKRLYWDARLRFAAGQRADGWRLLGHAAQRLLPWH